MPLTRHLYIDTAPVSVLNVMRYIMEWKHKETLSPVIRGYLSQIRRCNMVLNLNYITVQDIHISNYIIYNWIVLVAVFLFERIWVAYSIFGEYGTLHSSESVTIYVCMFHNKPHKMTYALPSTRRGQRNICINRHRTQAVEALLGTLMPVVSGKLRLVSILHVIPGLCRWTTNVR